MSLPEQLLDDAALGNLLGGKIAAAVRQMRHRDPKSLPPAIRVGGRIFYDPRDIEAWLNQMKGETTTQTAPSIMRFSTKEKMRDAG